MDRFDLLNLLVLHKAKYLSECTNMKHIGRKSRDRSGDFMEDAVPKTVTTATEKYLSLVYSFILNNRDALGYPVGSKETPYLYCTNDLVGKFTGLIKLCESKPVKPTPEVLQQIVQSLMETYENHKGESCCGFYHSVPKERFDALANAFLSKE